MKRGLFLFVILFASFAYAGDVILYNNWVNAGSPFNIGNETFFVNYIPESNATLIRFPEGISSALYASAMNCTHEWLYTVCQKGQKFQINGKDVPPDVRAESMDVSLFLIINRTDAGLNIKKEGLPLVFFLGDAVTVKARLEKAGSPIVYNVSYTDYFPGFNIESLSSSCKVEEEKIVFIAPAVENTVTCTYRLTPKFEMKTNNSELLSYVVLGKTMSKTRSTGLEVLTSPITIDLNYNNSQPIQSSVGFKIKIMNDEKAAPKEVLVTFPRGFSKILSSPDISTAENILRILNPKNTESFFVLESNFSGEYSVNVTVNYEYNGAVQQMKKTFPVDIRKRVFTLEIFRQENGSILRLSNTEPMAYKNIRIYVGETAFWLPFLDKNRYKEFFISSNNTAIGIVYQTEFGQFFNETHYLNYSVYSPPGQAKTEDEEKIKKSKVGFDITDLRINLPKQALLVAGIALLISLILIFIKSRPGKSKLDREIEELKKENEKEKQQV